MGDPEIKVLRTDALETEKFLEKLSRISDWNTALNVVARIQRLVNRKGTQGTLVWRKEGKLLLLLSN